MNVKEAYAARTPAAPVTLIADDQPDVLEALSLLLKRNGHRTLTAASPGAVLCAVRSHDIDLLLMDLNYARDTTSGREGLDLLDRIHSLDGTLPVVVMTAWGSVDLAVEAMHRGVGDFVQKPWDNARLLSILRAQIEEGRARRRTRRLTSSLSALSEEMRRADSAQTLIEIAQDHLREALRCSGVSIGSSGHPCAALAVPVLNGEELLATIQVESRPNGQPYDEEDRRYLEAAADHLARAWGELCRREHERDVELSSEIQRGFLPREIPQVHGFEISRFWRPARVVGGDYYDVIKFDEDHVAVCIADVVGKGMPAALLMSNLQAAVKASASVSTQPRDLCERVNRLLCRNVQPGRLISLFYGLLDAVTRRLVYAGAGHNPPILLRRDGSCSRLAEGGRVLGVAPDWSCRQGEIGLEPGDRLVMFTDGVTEARNDEDEEFGEGRLIDVVTRFRDLAPQAIHERIASALFRFCPGGIQDDATLLTVAVSAGRRSDSHGDEVEPMIAPRDA